jgi:hypothetical protein
MKAVTVGDKLECLVDAELHGFQLVGTIGGHGVARFVL